MRISSKAIAACALLTFSPLCLADVYFGAAGTATEYKYDDVKHGFGGQAFIGFRPVTFPMVFEVSYLSAGKSKIDNTVPTFALSFAGETASVGYYGRFDRKGSGAFAKLGYYTGKAKIEADGIGSLKVNNSGAMFSLGVDWMLAQNFGLRFDLGSLLGVKDFRDIQTTGGLDHKSNVTFFNLGVVFAFGGAEQNYSSRYPRESRAAPVYSPPVPAPVYSPAVEAAPVVATQAPMPQPVTEMAPAPVIAAAPVVRSSTVGSAQLVPGAVLRSGPTMKSAGIRTLPDGGSVKLLKRETNAEGPWWSVQLEDGTTGWIIEWGLARISKN